MADAPTPPAAPDFAAAADSAASTDSPAGSGSPAASDLDALSNQELLALLQADRLWLLRQIDSGAWPDWRLDLAALERELGELLDRVSESAGVQA
jgi:hypothetical protein